MVKGRVIIKSPQEAILMDVPETKGNQQKYNPIQWETPLRERSSGHHPPLYMNIMSGRKTSRDNPYKQHFLLNAFIPDYRVHPAGYGLH